MSLLQKIIAVVLEKCFGLRALFISCDEVLRPTITFFVKATRQSPYQLPDEVVELRELIAFSSLIPDS